MHLVKRFVTHLHGKGGSLNVIAVVGRLLMEMHFGACGDTVALSLPAVDPTVITLTPFPLSY